MVIIRDGRASNRKGREGRAILRIARPSKTAQLGGVEQFSLSQKLPENQDCLSGCEQWGIALWAARNVWDVQRRCKGLAAGKLNKQSAERALKNALANLAESEVGQ